MSAMLPSDESVVCSSTLDTSIIPLGERALRSILDYVVAVGDEAESAYLEVKSSLDMKSKATMVKIVKFLLGAANRRPKEAARYFQGYAVLVIGAQKGGALGVPRGTEAHELEDSVRPYLGPQFPAFEFGRIGVNSDHEVLFVIAQPPQEGQTIFPCHKSYQGSDRHDNLEDGAIYVRGTSNTRPAHSGEVLALVERARGGDSKKPIDLRVELVGQVHRVRCVKELLEYLLDLQEKKFLEESEIDKSDFFASGSLHLPPSVFGGLRPLSAEERKKALDSWRHKNVEHVEKGREYFLGIVLSGAGIRVVSRDRFIAKPHLTVTFHGCEVFDYLDQGESNFDRMVEPVLQKQDLLGISSRPPYLRVDLSDGPVVWRNQAEDAEVVLRLESFRPNTPWTTSQDGYVILARDPDVRSVKVSWSLTEDGNDNVVIGEFQVVTEKPVDAAELFKRVFLKRG